MTTGAANDLGTLTGTASLNVQPWVQGTRNALNALKEVTDYAKKNGTLTLTTKLSGTSAAAMRAQLDAALAGQALPVRISFDASSVNAAVQALRTQLNAVVALNLSTLTALQAQIAAQITQMNSLIAQLRALGGGGGARGGAGGSISQANQALLASLQALNNEYKRGDIDAGQYATRLTAIQAALRTAAAAATVGSAEFKALDRAVTQTVQSFRGLETSKITQLRTDLAGARAQFDAAAAAATNFAQRQAAIAAYTAEINRTRVALQAMASSGTLTAQQLGNVNRMLAQTARELNTIQGGVNLAGLSGNIQNAVQQLANFIPGLGQVQSLFGSMSAPMLAATAALAAFTAGMAAAFRTAADFQQGMAELRALTQPTAVELGELREAAMNIGAPLGVGARDAAAAILELNRAGLSATDAINGGLIGALNLAGAAGISAAEGGKLAVAAMTAFGKTAEDLPGIADVYAGFANETFLGAQNLADAMAAVGPVARQAGLEFDQFAGIMATLAQGGFKRMTDAGTSLKTMLLSLMAPADTAQKALERINFNANDAQGNFKGFSRIIDELQEKFATMTEQERNRNLKEIFGTDAVRAGTILLREGNVVIDANIKAVNKQGEASRVASDRLNSYNGEVAKLGAAWESFRIIVGEKLLPVMTALVQTVRTGVESLSDFGNTAQTAAQYTALLAAALVSLRINAIAAAAPGALAAVLAIVTALPARFAAAAVAARAFGAALIASNPLGLVLTAGTALTAGAVKIAKDTQGIYDQVDQAANASFEKTMARVAALNKEGTELSRTQAKLLLAQLQLQQAQEGEVTGSDVFGNRTVTVDADKVKAAQDRVAALRQEMTTLRTEAQRHQGIKATPGGPEFSERALDKQKEALEGLADTLAQRKFRLSLNGKNDLQKELAQIGYDFDQLKAKLEAPFTIGGKVQMTPELQKALNQLGAQQRAEEASARRSAANDAVTAARESALETQRAELAAMREGAAKRKAQRNLELEELRRDTAEKVAAVAGFPQQQARVEADGRTQVRALQRRWAQEDVDLARENAQRVQEAGRSARDATIAAMADGYAKEEALRKAALDDLRADIAERVRLLEGDPTAQGQVRASGARQVAALRAQQERERVQSAQDAQRLILEAEQAAEDARSRAQDARIAGMADGAAKEAALRQKALDDLERDIQRRVDAEAKRPAVQQAIREEGAAQRAALIAQQAREQQQAVRDAERAIRDAQEEGQDARIAAMAEGFEKEEALRRDALEDLRQDIADRVAAEAGRPDVQAAIRAAGEQQEAALIAQQGRERAEAIREAAQQVADAQREARDSTLSVMQEGYAKEVAIRRAAEQDLLDSLNREIANFKGTAAQREQLIRDSQTRANNLRQKNEQELKAIRDAATRTAQGTDRTARAAEIAAIEDEAERTRALRNEELRDLQENARQTLENFQGTAEEAQRIRDNARREQRAKQQQWANEDAAEAERQAREATQQVQDAVKGARAAQIAAIGDEAAQRRASRNQELRDLQEATRKTLETFKGSAAQAQAIREAARQTQAAKQQQWANEDAQTAKEAAARMVEAWRAVQDAQYNAQTAGRASQTAEFELQLSRRLAAVKENAVETARIEQEAIGERYQMAETQAEKQYAQEKQRLVNSLTTALQQEGLSRDARGALWAKFYADLDTLDANNLAGANKRLQDREEAERQAAENIRKARIEQAQKPADDSARLQSRLEAQKQITLSDVGILALNTQINAARERQIATYQGMLRGVGGVVLKEKERQEIEDKVLGLQRDQIVAQQEQINNARALTQSVFDRLDAEAQYMERIARSDQDVVNARTAQLLNAQARLRDLDTRIAGEGREQERNALIQQRLGLLGRVRELQEQIDDMPEAALQRQEALFRAQRGYALQLSELRDDAVTRAREALTTSLEEVQAAERRVQAADTQAERETALTELVGRRTAAIQAQQALVEARAAEEGRVLDRMEARQRAELQLRDLADDAVAAAELDLSITRERLALTDQQLARAGQDNLSAQQRLTLQQQQLTLQAQQAEQERALQQAQRDRVTLLENLSLAQTALNREMEGGTKNQRALAAVDAGLIESRLRLAQAERAYQEARERGKPEAIRTATEALTGAIRAQRDAVTALADSYRAQISAMDGVRDAADRLKQAAYGDAGQPFNSQRERARLEAIEVRRNAAQQALVDALAGGEVEVIQAAIEQLARQQERYKKQADLLDKNGVKFTRTGEQEVQRLADQVDELGITYDREAVSLQRRAELADKEAAAAMTFQGAVSIFGERVEAFLTGVQAQREYQPEPVRTVPTEVVFPQFAALLPGVSNRTGELSPVMFNSEALGVLNGGFKSVVDAIIQRGLTVPVHNAYSLSIGDINVSVPNGQSVATEVRTVVREIIQDAQRGKVWGDRGC